MKKFSYLSMLILISLAACGGGGSSGGGGVIPGPIPQPTAPVASPFSDSGKPESFFTSQGKTAAAAYARRTTMSASPTPMPSVSPSPTPTPFPTPGGNPLVPTRVAIGDGVGIGIGSIITVEVLDPVKLIPILEPTAPQVFSDLASVPPGPPSNRSLPVGLPDAWQFALNILEGLKPQVFHVAAKFPDSTGVVTVYQYDAFVFGAQAGQGVDLTTGQNIPQTGPTGDVTQTGTVINFPYGAELVAGANPDAFGNTMPALNDDKSVGTFTSTLTSIPNDNSIAGNIYHVRDAKGQIHKLMIVSATNGGITFGIELLQSPDGSFAF